MPEVKDTTDRFVAAFNAHDDRALDALHADDIKFNAPGGFKATNAKEEALANARVLALVTPRASER